MYLTIDQEKTKIEEAERQKRKEREAKSQKWTPVYFEVRLIFLLLPTHTYHDIIVYVLCYVLCYVTRGCNHSEY